MITSRRALAVITAGCAALTTAVAGAAPRPACTTVSDRSGDESPGATGSDARLDVLATQSWVAAGNLVSRIRLRDLAATGVPSSSGVQYSVSFTRTSETYELSANLDVTGTTFVARVHRAEEASTVALPGGDIPIEGVVDEKSSTVTLSVPVRTLGPLRPLTAGSTVTRMEARASRWLGTYPTGGALSTADSARSASYVLGRAC